ncbi:unnamed protein product [Debaryomyces fabryi]|nr:unnamed protein product [Debaryomyces fabryi]
MPEVAEVAHVCALIRRNLLGFSISKLNMNNDPLLFPFLKNNPNADQELVDLQSTLTGSTVKSVGRHGKYFWLRLNLNKGSKDQTGVLLMHFGMTGMIKIKNVKSHLIFMENGGDKKVLKRLEEEKKSTGAQSEYFKKEEDDDARSLEVDKSVTEVKFEDTKKLEDASESDQEEWPPKFVKFEMELQKDNDKFDLAFVDPRRLGRVRFLSGPLVQSDDDLMKQEPLSALGPDYSKPLEMPQTEFTTGDPDPDSHGKSRLSLEEFNELILSKKKPIKSLLLEQGFFAGVGNWMGDEILYHARIHPNEVLSSKIPKGDSVDNIIERLYNSILYVCELSVRVEGDVSQFPSNWLMIYRWGKRRKNSLKPKTDEGYEVDHITVGGRTSCFVPELQKIISKRAASEARDTKELDSKKKPKRRKV